MAAVWQSTLAASLKLPALALADWADDEGGNIHPSIKTAARKCSKSSAQLRRDLRQLEALGIVTVEANANGGPPGSTRHYRLHLDRLPTARTNTTPRIDATPRIEGRDGLHGCTETACMGKSLFVNEPSVTTNVALKHGFDRFWNAYPTGSNRRSARKRCLEVWKRKRCAEQVDVIVAHVEAMKESPSWRDGYEPASLTYLNQERWLDGLPVVDRGPRNQERRVAL